MGLIGVEQLTRRGRQLGLHRDAQQDAGSSAIGVDDNESPRPYSKSLPPAAARGRLCESMLRRNYGLGAGEVVVVVVVVSVLVSGAGDASFTMVVLVSVLFSAGGLVMVVSFFSQAAKSATPAIRQMYFFIGANLEYRPAIMDWGSESSRPDSS